MFYLHHTPWWLRLLFPKGLQWQGPVLQDNEVYLTFDDGPHPEATPFVLDQLKAAGMQGTFFCIGKNVQQHPAIYQRILAEGHAVGNHTMHHLNGRKTTTSNYVADVDAAASVIHSQLFRPPYGQITKAKATQIRSRYPDMSVVMWTVLTGDFDTAKNGEDCFAAVQKHTRPGCIIVFHDSAKAMPRLQEALPLTLAWLQQKGLHSKAIL